MSKERTDRENERNEEGGRGREDESSPDFQRVADEIGRRFRPALDALASPEGRSDSE